MTKKLLPGLLLFMLLFTSLLSANEEHSNEEIYYSDAIEFLQSCNVFAVENLLLGFSALVAILQKTSASKSIVYVVMYGVLSESMYATFPSLFVKDFKKSHADLSTNLACLFWVVVVHKEYIKNTRAFTLTFSCG